MALDDYSVVRQRLIKGAKEYILGWDTEEKPTLDRMLDIILADKIIGSCEIEQISDAIFDIEGWLSSCVRQLNARMFERRVEEEQEVRDRRGTHP